MTMVGDTQRKGETKPELWKRALWAFTNTGRGDFDYFDDFDDIDDLMILMIW